MTIRKLPELQLVTALAGAGGDLPAFAVENWNAAISAKGEQSANVISILDVIGESFFGEGFTSKRMSAALRSIGNQEVEVHVNSPGGSYVEGVTMFNMLRQHPNKVTVKILGIAASAASIIAMAGDRIEIAKAGFVFVHNSEAITAGNRHDLQGTVDMLKTFDDAMVSLYSARTGLDAGAVIKLMDAETVMAGATAVEKGFADVLLATDAVEATAFASLERAAQAAAHRLDSLLAKAGVTRAERRDLIKTFKAGTQNAAEDATPSAGVSAELSSVLGHIDIPLSH